MTTNRFVRNLVVNNWDPISGITIAENSNKEIIRVERGPDECALNVTRTSLINRITKSREGKITFVKGTGNGSIWVKLDGRMEPIAEYVLENNKYKVFPIVNGQYQKEDGEDKIKSIESNPLEYLVEHLE